MSDFNQDEKDQVEEAPVVEDAATGEDRLAGDNESTASAPAEHEGEAIEAPVPDVVAQEAKIVGDDELEVFKVEPEVVSEQVDAQVAQPREADRDKVDVHETSVMLDEVITDPSDPRAVIVPDAGRGSLDLPIHKVALGLPKFD